MLILTNPPGLNGWRSLLADPNKQWKTGFSAKELAQSWEDAKGKGFPPKVRKALDNASDAAIAGLEPLIAIPEFKVPLPGGNRPSQNDIFCLARSASNAPVTIMVEGKANESFGPTIGEWKKNASSGKLRRLQFLIQKIGLPVQAPDSLRYQLLHRAASTVITGEQYRAGAAILLIHSFSKDLAGWPDFIAFANLFGVNPVVGKVERFAGNSSVPLFGVWIKDRPWSAQSQATS